ncbi:ABC transporter ATP-binding protein [Haloarcula pellucida]|uniref:Copper ABC transporter ATP-binding protein n=1 Tax=Haloarcula pellucida TaxID=1427151 RepID=A0A830GKY4_9EURY|nr:ABC transporter ATP-binding protein [Halomicroarcula pellucida]MBX0350449.1 ABC transporter ATP-binding protein [Halomicroarcula pellucida]GGN91085.1 copper ABC transporter ATP-binding protein [Halomicroarcula pellucida]
MTAIELDGVRKEFGDVVALNGVDLTVEEGEVFGFLGPNGAGKSTTINILLDFVRPTAGSATVLGHDVNEESKAIRERIGVLPEGYDVYERLTGREHVEFVIESKNADDDPMALLERVGVADAADRRAGGYSKGMKQRLVLAMALVDEPDLLILDEPTTGLDPNGARKMRDLVREESERGATVFFSSHILGQVESVCDTVGILQDGELVAKDSVEGLRAAAQGDMKLVVTVGDTDGLDAAVEDVRSLPEVSGVTMDTDRITVNCDGDAKMTVLNTFEESGVAVEDFETQEASLEDLFTAYTERQEVEA